MKQNDEEYLIRYTPEQKREWWGEGEWVTEPDQALFSHNGLYCKVVRVTEQEPYAKEFHMFGGHLCGYVAVPFDHPYYQKQYEEMEIDCHGGLTYGECSDRHWIGFDCAHSFDITPSTEILYEKIPEMKEFKKNQEKLFKYLKSDHFLNKSYKNMDFCIKECKSIADQLLSLQGK